MKRIISILFLTALAATSFAQNQEVHFFAHRGGAAEFDQNTLYAFEQSYQQGMRGYETDIRMTADGELVILHDSNFKKKFNIDLVVENAPASKIREIKTPKGNDILFFEDLMKWLESKGDVAYVEFEMKTTPKDLYPQARLEEYCEKLYTRAMKNKPASATYLFTSSDHRALAYLQKAHPEAELLVITGKPCCEETIKMCLDLGIKRLGARMEKTSRGDVKAAHEKGLIVSLWPGSNTNDAVLGIYLGADYLCTDRPVAVKKFITEKFPDIKAVF